MRLAAQDVFWEDDGAYTGEVSPVMLQEMGVSYVLVGHSERRLYLGETDRTVNRKVRAALRTGLMPVVCVGEQEAARESGRAKVTVRSQVARALEAAGRAESLAREPRDVPDVYDKPALRRRREPRCRLVETRFTFHGAPFGQEALGFSSTRGTPSTCRLCRRMKPQFSQPSPAA